MKKVGRNDPCPCGSGKKFKKCCESSMLGGKFKATKVDTMEAPRVASATRLTGLFQTQVATIGAPPGGFRASKGDAVAPEMATASAENAASSSTGVEQKVDI